MSLGVGVDVGASVVKVGTADSAEGRSTNKGPREIVFPELVSRVGTHVPHVRVKGHAVLSRASHDLFVDEVLQAVGQLSTGIPAAGAGTMIIAPDWWTAHACDSVRGALHEAGMTEASLVSGAIAAVRGYRASASSMPSTVAVLDLGAHTCSAAIVTGCQSDDIARVGPATVVHGRGGNDLDARLLHHVLDGLRAQGHTYRHDDAEAVVAARALLVECQSAKESLSIRPVATMSPHLPGSAAQFRLVRAEHDDVARPAVREIVQVLKDCISAGGVDVDAVLLVGGGAPIPIVTQQISVELGLPVLLDADPSTLAARGAALEALAAAPMMTRGEARRILGLGAWWSRSRSQRGSVTGSRHRGRRAGVTAAYLAVALLATGAPAPSQAGPSGPTDSGPTTASQDAETPPDIRPIPPSTETETESDAESDAESWIDPQLNQTFSSPTDPTATSVTPEKETKPNESDSASDSASGTTGSAEGSGSGSDSSTPPADLPADLPADPSADPSAGDPSPTTDDPGGEVSADVQP